MKKWTILISILFLSVAFITGCTQDGRDTQKGTPEVACLETVEVSSDDPLVYLEAKSGYASSFDQTPDWAPEPDPMGAADGDMITRWSSDYVEGPQWISFDVGKDSVVSDVIVKWERAYATDYKILGSMDGNSWCEIVHVQKSPGGTVRSSFTPVKTRYIKILGLKRVNDDWGISIWEVEIYGPKSHNPEALITMEEYLQKGEDEEMQKEAEKRLNELSSPVVPISENAFQKGVVYTSWMADELLMPASDLTLADLKEMGVDTVAIMVPAYQEDLDSEILFTNDKPDGDTPTDEALKHAVASCHKLGMRVMIKPHVDPRTDEARINIRPSEKWFDSFEAFTLRYAKFSEENNVELFSIGTELEATTFSAWNHRWLGIIEKVKEVYTGKLTYSANWTEYKEVPFWQELDFIGIDAYFPLTSDNEAAKDDFVAAWEKLADEIEAWLTEKGLTEKGVLLTEIGYPSADGANTQPWVAISNVEDQQEQADCLEAVFEVLTKRPWFKGYYVWQYFPQERWSPLGFTLNGKKAEEVFKKWLKK